MRTKTLPEAYSTRQGVRSRHAGAAWGAASILYPYQRKTIARLAQSVQYGLVLLRIV